jgi:hypothetical protein
MNVKVSFLLVVCLFFSCEKESRPSGVMSQEELSRFLVDIYLAESRLMSNPLQKDSAMKIFLPYEQKFLTAKGIADSTVRKTYEYYLQHPQELEAVYDAVIDTLSLREQRAMKTKEGV